MKPKHQRMLLIVLSLCCLGAGISLILYNFRTNIVFFYSPADLITRNDIQGKTIRIGGLVKTGSIHKQEGTLLTEFVLTVQKAEVSVRYKGILPVLFREGQGIVAKGKMGEGRVFIADELLAKHDENYMPKEIADALKKSGHWKPE